MLFDHDAGRTLEELIQARLNRMPEAMLERLQREADRRGLTFNEFINERLEEIADEYDEKLRQGTLRAELDFLEQPFGRDPRQGGA